MTIPQEITQRFAGLRHLIGNTPLLEIHFEFQGEQRRIFAKLESLNLTGSIKDRMALHILQQAYASGAIKPGDTIAEATSGNTGIAFAAIGRALGHPVTIFMPDWMSRERVDLIRSLGASIIPVTHKEGGFLGSIRKAETMAETQPKVFLPRQFENQANVEAHAKTTAPELWWQLHFKQLQPAAFVAGVGTGGTVMGVGSFLKAQQPSIRIHPMEPKESPTLTTGHKVGKHRIQGISDEFIPPIVKLDELDEIIDIADGDAILMAQKLSTELGLAVGISSGGNFIAALKAQEKLGGDAIVATVFADDNKKYLSTDLLRVEDEHPDYLAPQIKLKSFSSMKRVCQTCCDTEKCTQQHTGPCASP
jgi:cysteine synthase A